MNHRHLRPTPAPSRVVTPFHRGPSAQTGGPSGSSPNYSAPNAAMLIDFDNVTMGIRSDLQAELKNLLESDIIKGKVAVRRAYADWRRYPQYIVPLTESSIDLIFAPAYGSSKKNATDIRLAIDALELVFTRPEIGTFVLLSGDSDFSSMVIKLKEYGKYVIGVGIRESSSDLLVMNCDEYYSYNALAGLVKTGDDESTRWDPYQLVTEAVGRMKRNGDVMRSDRLKQVMQEIDSSFDEKNLGMAKFSRFVQEAAHRGLLRSTKLENGQLEVDVPLNPPPATATTSGASATTDGAAPVVSAEIEERPRPDRDRDDPRRGRRGRRGRGRDRGDRETREFETPSSDATSTGEHAADSSESTSEHGSAAPSLAATQTFQTPAFTAALAQDARPVSSAPIAASVPPVTHVATPTFGESVPDSIGRSGERLTRTEAFDLVRRSVESLVTGEETTSASAVRKRAHELLTRDSESLSARNFERILRDAHDVDMIDLRRRGNDFEVARAAAAAPIVEQLKSAEQAHKAAAAASAPPPAPRGMSARGIGGRPKAGRAGAVPSADMLLVGVVGAKPAPTVRAAEPVVVATTPAPVAAAPSKVAEAPVVEAAPAAPVAAAAPKRGRKPGVKAAEKAPAKPAAKAPRAAKTAAKAEPKAPAKKTAKKAAKTSRK